MLYANLNEQEKATYEIVAKVVKSNRKVIDRVMKLLEMGFVCGYKAMGNGGKFQLQTYKQVVIMQIGYGRTKWNYADYVYLTKPEEVKLPVNETEGDINLFDKDTFDEESKFIEIDEEEIDKNTADEINKWIASDDAKWLKIPNEAKK